MTHAAHQALRSQLLPGDRLQRRPSSTTMDASSVKCAATPNEIVNALLTITSAPSQLDELAVRLDIRSSIPSPDSTTPRRYARSIVDSFAALE